MIVGICGKANVGKSTFFKAATLADTYIANYPFATIKPNTGVAYVNVECVDKEFRTQCNPREGFCVDHNRFVPVQLIDVAGLVPGAHAGKGLGNQFLSDLNQADVLIEVIDAAGATNERGEPTATNARDPAEDIKFLEYELDMWYAQVLQRSWDKAKQRIHLKEDAVKVITQQLSGMKVTEEMVKAVVAKLPEKISEWSSKVMEEIASALRRTSKPMIIAANKVDIPEAEENVKRLQKQFPQLKIIPVAADAELALREATKKELIQYIPGSGAFEMKKSLPKVQADALQYIKDNVLGKCGSTGVQECLNIAVFDVLKYIAIFPGGVNKLEDKDGNVLPDCFLLPQGATALDFAFRIHSDIGNNFVKAVDVKTKRAVGKDHILKHRDVIEIMTKK